MPEATRGWTGITMDCEKFESAMMDELYGELDELTSAAVKRHVAGCARCAALLGGLRATRRLAVLGMVEPPAALEDRILRVANETPLVVPLGRRLARAVSLAGSWAMRPQTAMAAVFLVMIGTSLLLLRGKSSRAPASASITVTEQGTPAPVASVGAGRAPEPLAFSTPPLGPNSGARLSEAKGAAAAAPPAAFADSPLGAARPRAAAKAAATADGTNAAPSQRSVDQEAAREPEEPPAAAAGMLERAGGGGGVAAAAPAAPVAPPPAARAFA